MYFLWNEKIDGLAPKIVTVVFGSGLIGAAMIRALRDKTSDEEHFYKQVEFPWDNISQQSMALNSVAKEMYEYFSMAGKIEVIWSAGKTGFNSSQADVDAELLNYNVVLNWLDELQKTHNANITVNLISSLGGLFEHEELINAQSIPNPVRVYGHLKLTQENVLARKENLDKRIYRVASAYGHVSNAKRMGLISTLIMNGLNNKCTLLSGSLDTLRDYIWVDDLADYVVADIYSGKHLSSIQYVASFRSHSIQNIIEKVEFLINKNILLHHDSHPTNACSISICPSLKPPELALSDINHTLQTIIEGL